MPVSPAMFSATAMPSSSALCASIGPGITSPIAQTPGTLVAKSWSVSIWPRALTARPIASRPRPSVLGRRPIATSTTSASSDSPAPPAAGSTATVALPPLTVTPVTLVASFRVMPCFLKILAASLRTSPSMPGSNWSRYSTTVTCAPSRPQTEPSSSPITPPPITTILPGTLSSSSAPVLSTTTFWSTVTPGSGVTDDPVAMTTFFAVTVRSPTLTLCALSKEARPLIQSTLFFLNRNSIPPVNCLTESRRCPCIASRSSSGVTLTPSFAISPEAAAWKYSEAWSMAFDGMQPTLRQVPPSVSRLSAQAVFSPSCAARIAAT